MGKFDTFAYIVDYKWLKLRKRTRRVVAETGQTMYTGPWRWTNSAVSGDMLDDSFFCVAGVFFGDSEDWEPPTI